MKGGWRGVAVIAAGLVSYLKHLSSLEACFKADIIQRPAGWLSAGRCLAATRSRWEERFYLSGGNAAPSRPKMGRRLRWAAVKVARARGVSAEVVDISVLFLKSVPLLIPSARYAFDLWRWTASLRNHKYRRVCLVSCQCPGLHFHVTLVVFL